jgi:hypothetical protein
MRDCFDPEALFTAVRMMNKYADIPMDFPDATLVQIAEQTGTENVLTLDKRGFSSFRFGRNRRFTLLLDSDVEALPPSPRVQRCNQHFGQTTNGHESLKPISLRYWCPDVRRLPD